MNTDYGLIAGIISLIALITFFVMAWRLGTLTNKVNQIGGRIINQPFYDAQLEEVKGKTNEAIEKYIEVLYLVTVAGYTIGPRSRGATTIFIKEKIETLGGTIPDLLIEKNEFL